MSLCSEAPTPLWKKSQSQEATNWFEVGTRLLGGTRRGREPLKKNGCLPQVLTT